jgi:demethylspheroidene O-methyltransferase
LRSKQNGSFLKGWHYVLHNQTIHREASMAHTNALHLHLPSLRDRWLAMRDKILASPRFIRLARSSSFTNGIAKRRARELFDLVAGFVYSQVLQTCVQIDLFKLLAEAPATACELALKTEMSEPAMQQLLVAACSLRLVEARAHERFGLGPLGAALVANPGVAAMIEHHAMFYRDLQDPVALLRDQLPCTELQRYWSYTNCPHPNKLTNTDVERYSALMAASVGLVAEEVVDAYPIEQYRCLLDIGGGEGGFIRTAAARAPKLRFMLFDLKPVAERARLKLSQAGLSDRCTVTGGDVFADPLPEGADIASLLRVIHDHDDDRALQILRAVRKALPDNGILLLAEPMSGTTGAEPMSDAYFAFYLRAMGRGQPRSREHLTSLLNQAGFPYVRLLPTNLPLQTQLLMASPKG